MLLGFNQICETPEMSLKASHCKGGGTMTTSFDTALMDGVGGLGVGALPSACPDAGTVEPISCWRGAVSRSSAGQRLACPFL